MNNPRELSNKRAGLKVEAQTILDVAEKEKRTLTVEEREKFDELTGQIEALAGDIQRAEKMATLRAEAPAKGVNPLAAEIGMSDAEVKRYSFVRAINAAAENNWSQAGLEREASVAVAQRFGRSPRSFFVPNDVMIGTREARERRDLTVGSPTGGGYMVATDTWPLIELLRNRLALAAAGVRILTGLVGDVAIPAHTAASTGYWVAESGAPTEGAPTLGQVAMTPHTFGAYNDISRKLLKQSSVDVENFVRDDLTRVIGLGVDYAGLHGNHNSDANQPDGVAATTGIGSVVGGTNGAAPDWTDIVDLETEVAVDNADIGTLRYITNAKVRGKLKKTLITATYGDQMVWDSRNPNTPLNGYPAIVSNQVSSTLTKGNSSVASAIFFGNWDDLVLGIWGDGVDILVDPYSLSTQGALRVVAFQDVDFAVRHAGSFAAMLDALTA
jgi:HK97 family phage major capsid protein